MYSTAEFRNGLKIEFEGVPYIIVEFQHVKPGKGGAFVRTKIKNLITGRVLDPTFKSGDKVGRPNLDELQMQYLYHEGEHYTFMDTATYDQVVIERDALGDQVNWLSESCPCSILFWNGKAIGIQLPNFVTLKIVMCEPGVRGNTATGTMKPATLETGAIVNVPLFINQDESIKIDTRTGEYAERA